MAEHEKQAGQTLVDQSNGDDELKAMNAIVAALSPLRDEQRSRVLDYVLSRFGVTALRSNPTVQGSPLPLASEAPQRTGQVHDIRSLKEAKAPKSANEMAALVAYYLSELAQEGDKKSTIGKADVEKYFKTAGFRLPADANFTLVNAKNAGYLDSAGGGQYKLNPVGYNLVAHRMGADKKGPLRKR
jgi:hypothetical protein